MKLIVWLGNPGKKYENTRHNVGFLTVDSLRKRFDASEWEDIERFYALQSEFTIHDSRFTMIKPITFMNLSGDSVASMVNFYKLDPKTDLLVISDDLDMEFGKVRFRTSGSSWGQKWLKSIIEKLGTDEFSRVKIGIGRDPRYEVSDWVLSRFTKEELEVLEKEVFERVVSYIEEFISQ